MRATQIISTKNLTSSFSKTNRELDKTMKTHLIDELDEFGVWKDDYDKFIKMRGKKVSEEIEKRIIHQDIDTEGQEPILDDEEDVEI